MTSVLSKSFVQSNFDKCRRKTHSGVGMCQEAGRCVVMCSAGPVVTTTDVGLPLARPHTPGLSNVGHGHKQKLSLPAIYCGKYWLLYGT